MILQDGKTQSKQTLGTKIIAVILLALTVVVLRQGWILFQYFMQALKNSPDPIKAAVIGGSATVLVAVLTLTGNARYQSRREIESEHRKQKAEIYEEFMKFMFELLIRDKLKREPATELEIMQFAVRFNQRMIVWGSDEVLHEWIKFRDASQNHSGSDPSNMLKVMEGLLYSIRKDLGHKNKNLGEYDLLRLFINDIDEIKMIA